MAIVTKYLRKYPLDNGQTLMLNTLTSALDIVDGPTMLRLNAMAQGQQEITAQSDGELHEQLVKRGYIFEDAEQEKTVLRKLHDFTLAVPFSNVPTRFIVCPTMGCNLRCTYCFEDIEQHQSFGSLSPGQLESILAYIHECAQQYAELRQDPIASRLLWEEPSIGLFGGEPLIRRNRWIVERILEFAEAIPMKVKVITNGTQVRHFLDLIERYHETLQFQVTLDGGRASHDKRRIRANGTGTFDEVCRAVDLLIERQVHVALRVNFDRANTGDVDELRSLFDAHGWRDSPLVTPYASAVMDFTADGPDVLQESEMLDALYSCGAYGSDDAIFGALVSPAISFVEGFFAVENNLMKPWKLSYCEATNGSNICFTPDGALTTCLTYVGKGEFTIGTFDDEGVHIDPQAYARWRDRDAFNMSPCAECDLLLMCGGGCPVKALRRYGDIDRPVCSDVERTLEVHVKHINARFVG